MTSYWTQMFSSDSEATSLTQMNSGTSATAGDFSPLRDGQLLEVRLEIGYTTASSLIEGIRVELTETDWNPNTMMFYVTGEGLHTAPALGGTRSSTRWPVKQPVRKSSPIAGEIINVGGASPVTVNVFVFGGFTG